MHPSHTFQLKNCQIFDKLSETHIETCRIIKNSVEIVLNLIYSHYSRFSPVYLSISLLHTKLSRIFLIDLFGKRWYSIYEKAVER